MIGFGRRNFEIKSLSDERLILVDPTATGFYDHILQLEPVDERINSFIEAVREVKEAGLAPFWRLAMDPSIIDEKIIYSQGHFPAVGHSYTWWNANAEEMQPIEDNIWLLGNEYEYYADEVDMINWLVAAGCTATEAINMFIKKSSQLSYRNADISQIRTGMGVYLCGRWDLGMTCKILRNSDEKAGGYWVAGKDRIRNEPLAGLCHRFDVEEKLHDGVGWYILRSNSGN